MNKENDFLNLQLNKAVKNNDDINNILNSKDLVYIYPFVLGIKNITNDMLMCIYKKQPTIFKYIVEYITLNRIYLIFNCNDTNISIEIFKYCVTHNIDKYILTILYNNNVWYDENMYIYYLTSQMAISGSNVSLNVHNFFINNKFDTRLYVHYFVDNLIEGLYQSDDASTYLRQVRIYIDILEYASKECVDKLEQSCIYMNNNKSDRKRIVDAIIHRTPFICDVLDENIINLMIRLNYSMDNVTISYSNIIFLAEHQKCELSKYVVRECKYDKDTNEEIKECYKNMDLYTMIKHTPNYSCTKCVIKSLHPKRLNNTQIDDIYYPHELEYMQLINLFNKYVPKEDEINSTKRTDDGICHKFDTGNITYKQDHIVKLSFMLQMLCDTTEQVLSYCDFCDHVLQTCKGSIKGIIKPQTYKDMELCKIKHTRIINTLFISQYTNIDICYHVYFDLRNFIDYCIKEYSL